MKVAMVGDSHFDEHKRFAECIRLHQWIHNDCQKRGVDLVLHGGDVFERKSTPLEREAAFGWFQKMADLAPVIVTRGNHDSLADLPLLTKLESEHPIIVVEEAAVVEAAGALIACVAWPRKSALLAATGADSRDAGEGFAAEALRNVLRGLGDEMRDHAGPTMLLMHAMVRDSMTSTGQPLVGADLEIGLDDLALVGAGAYFLAHIHMHQTWRIGAAPCIYPGSPRRTNFGELEPKGYVVADFADDGTLLRWQFVEVPATPMIHLEDDWGPDGWLAHVRGLPESRAGIELRFRYRVQSDQRHAARASAEAFRAHWLAEGAISVQLDEQVMLEHRTRADGIPPDAPLEEKIQAFWRAKSFEPGDRAEALLSKIRRIEEAGHP